MNIALIAMSGVRCRNEELLELGLTLPGFVERSKVIASMPSLGLLTLAGMTPARHRIDYIEVDDIKAADLPAGFDLYAISTFSAQIFEAYELADRIRAAGGTVVIGGPHASVLPDEVLEHADAAVIGEGEAVWLQVLTDAEAGELKPKYGCRNGGFDLADAPMPAFDLLDIPRYNRLTVQTQRGCPHHCEFCAATPLITNRYKQKPVAKVLAEIDRILSLWTRPFLEFADDNSVVNKRYWMELCREMEKRPLRWFTETDISVAEHPELLERMRAAGCAQILVGLESPVDAGLTGLEMKRDWKHKRMARYREAIETIQSHGITVNGCFILGLDGQTPDVFDRVYDFVADTGLYEVQITILTPFPGTPLYERLKREGRLLEDRRWDKCTLFDINHRPTHMTVGQLDRGFKDLAKRLYCEEFTAWRRREFHRRLRKSA